VSHFYQYFKENMDGLGLPAPETLFGSLQAAVGNAAIFLSHIDKFGRGTTVRELCVAGTRLEKLGVVATLSASYYVGAVIGSIAVATGRTLSGGTSIADVMLLANQHKLNRPWLASILSTWPAIIATDSSTSRRFPLHPAAR
jgi:hypothetical protein